MNTLSSVGLIFSVVGLCFTAAAATGRVMFLHYVAITFCVVGVGLTLSGVADALGVFA